MKPNLAVLLLLLLPLSDNLAAKDNHPSQSQPDANEQNETPTVASTLSAQVRDIASSSTLSRKSQAKLIANAVRLAITTAIEGIKDPEARLKLALELTTVATKAAPHFAATITSAVTSIPSIAKIEGAQDEIKEAVKKGQEHDDEPDLANPSRDQGHHEHEFDGPDKGEHVVSPSH